MLSHDESVTKVRDIEEQELKTLAAAISANSDGLEKLGEEVKAEERRNRNKIESLFHALKKRLRKQKASTQTIHL